MRAAVDCINAAFPPRDSIPHDLVSNNSVQTEYISADLIASHQVSFPSANFLHQDSMQDFVSPQTPSQLLKPAPPTKQRASAGPNRARRNHVRGVQSRSGCSNPLLPRSLASSFPDERLQATGLKKSLEASCSGTLDPAKSECLDPQHFIQYLTSSEHRAPTVGCSLSSTLLDGLWHYSQ